MEPDEDEEREGRDLGVYRVRAVLNDGRQFEVPWETSGRMAPIGWIPPTWSDEGDLLGTIRYMFLDGNYGCDCNKRLFLGRASGLGITETGPCGDTLGLFSLTAIRPDGTEVPINIDDETPLPGDGGTA